MGKALTTGCLDSNACYVKTELMDLTTFEWTDGPDYPFASRLFYYSNLISNNKCLRINSYSTSSTAQATYIIGGYSSPDRLDTIAEFKNNQWSKLGSLSNARWHHGSIRVGDLTMIIGGYAGSYQT